MLNHQLLVAHGSKSLDHSRAFQTLLENYKNLNPDLVVSHGFLDYCEPRAEQVLAKLLEQKKSVTLVPIFLSEAKHLTEDIPELIRHARNKEPLANIKVSKALGHSFELKNLLQKELAWQLKQNGWHAPDTHLILCGRGSSIAPSLDFVFNLCTQIELPFREKKVCFWDVATPSFHRVLEQHLKGNVSQLLLQPLFLFPGILLKKLEERMTTAFLNSSSKKYQICSTISEMETLPEILQQLSSEAKVF